MATTAPGDVIEATATSTPAQGQGNRQQRRAQGKTKATAKVTQELEAVTDDKTPEVTENVPSKPAKAVFAVGHGLHRVGRSLADANLRKVGKGIKALGHQIPTVHFERRDNDAVEE